MTDVTCILNAKAGSYDIVAIREKLDRLFAKQEATAHILVAQSGDEIRAYASQAAAIMHLVVAGGGDGTINAVASTLAGTDAVLGVLPLGTMNHFARDLGIPHDLDRAVCTILGGQIARVDVGEVNGQIFLNNSSLGAYAQLVRGRHALQGGGRSKWLAFAMAVIGTLRHPAPMTVHLKLAGAERPSCRTPLLFVGNNRYNMNGLQMGGRSRIDTGRLWVCTAPQTGRGRLMRLALQALVGRLRPDDLEAWDATEFWVETRKHRVDVAWDGEVTSLVSPLHYRIRPGALRVMVPCRVNRIV